MRNWIAIIITFFAFTVGLPLTLWLGRTYIAVVWLLVQRKEMSARMLFRELPGHSHGLIMVSLSCGVRAETMAYRGYSFGRVYRRNDRPRRPDRTSWRERMQSITPLGGEAWAH